MSNGASIADDSRATIPHHALRAVPRRANITSVPRLPYCRLPSGTLRQVIDDLGEIRWLWRFVGRLVVLPTEAAGSAGLVLLAVQCQIKEGQRELQRLGFRALAGGESTELGRQ